MIALHTSMNQSGEVFLKKIGQIETVRHQIMKLKQESTELCDVSQSLQGK